MDIQLTSVTISHFKSYSEKVTFDLRDQFVCITGKNGCGKSALIDAICCCTGVDKRKLRVSSYEELITHLDNQIYDNCSIELRFQNIKEKKSESVISFSATSSGNTVFRYNGKAITRERLRSVMQSQLGLPVHPNPLFVIQQNHIQTFCCNDPSFLVDYLHEIDGTNQFLSFVNDYEKQVPILKKQIDSINTTLHQKQQHLKDIQTRVTNQKKVKEIENTQHTKQKELTSKRKQLKMIEVSQYRKEKEELEEEYQKITTELENWQERIEEEEKQREEMKHTQDNIHKQQLVLNQLTDEENSLKRELEGMKTKEDNLNQEKKQLQQQRRELIEVQRTIRECHSREIPFNQLQHLLQSSYTNQTLKEYQAQQTSLERKLNSLTQTIHQLQQKIDSEDQQYTTYDQVYQELIQTRYHILHYVFSPPSQYMGLVLELFRFQSTTHYKSCLLLLLNPFRKIHLCKDYEGSTELIRQCSHQNIRVWVYDQLCKKYSKTLPTLQIQEGSIHLLHPLSLCDHSNPSHYPVYNAITENTYFLNTEDYPLANPTHLHSLQTALVKYSIRVITTDGTIHSRGILIGGNVQQMNTDQEILQIGHQAYLLTQLRHYMEWKNELREKEIEREECVYQISKLKQQNVADCDPHMIEVLQTVNQPINSSSSYKELETNLLSMQAENDNRSQIIDDELLQLSITYQAQTSYLHQIHETINATQQTLSQLMNQSNRIQSPTLSTGDDAFTHLLEKQTSVLKRIDEVTERLDTMKDVRVTKTMIGNPESIQEDIKKLQEELNSLSNQLLVIKTQTTKTKETQSIDEIEKSYQDLLKQRDVIVNGLQLLEKDVILTQKKVKEIGMKTYDSISRDFSNYCKKLIPEKDIELTKINEGIQIRIRNNKQDEWKASLIELSGGQRSLVSIALILSQVTFKPFCLYIFDEIDAALDEENTVRVVRLINEVVSKLRIQVISISHHSVFQMNSTTIIKVLIKLLLNYKIGKNEYGSSVILE